MRDAIVLGTVALGPHHHASNTRHIIDGTEVRKFSRLELIHADGQSGYFLIYLLPDGTCTDTWHQTADDALHQAEWEFGVAPEEWTITGA